MVDAARHEKAESRHQLCVSTASAMKVPAVSWEVLNRLDIGYVNDVCGDIQNSRHLDVLAFKGFGFFLIVQVHTFSSLLICK
jgi:hypothetical protein